MSVAFWYPVDGKPWHGSGHYSVSCDWVPLDISVRSSMLTKVRQSSSVSAASVFALLLSVISLCASVFIGYWVVKPKTIPFTPMENLQNTCLGVESVNWDCILNLYYMSLFFFNTFNIIIKIQLSDYFNCTTGIEVVYCLLIVVGCSFFFCTNFSLLFVNGCSNSLVKERNALYYT